jgi:hypothetical protein
LQKKETDDSHSSTDSEAESYNRSESIMMEASFAETSEEGT